MPIISLGSILKPAIGGQPEQVTDKFFGNDSGISIEPTLSDRQEILINKRTHQIRFERENENEVTIVIQKKQDATANAQIDPKSPIT